MSELDVIKERITYLKLWLGIMVVTDISLAGWFVVNITTAPGLLLAAGLTVLLAVLIGIIMIHRRIDRYIETLQEL